MADDGNFAEDLANRIENITSPWSKSLEAAQAHGAAGKIMIEEAKLDAVKEIKAKLASY